MPITHLILVFMVSSIWLCDVWNHKNQISIMIHWKILAIYMWDTKSCVTPFRRKFTTYNTIWTVDLAPAQCNIIRMVTFGGGNITECSYRGVWNDIEGRLSVPRRSRGTYILPEILFQTPRYWEHSVMFPTTKSPSVILYGYPLPCSASA